MEKLFLIMKKESHNMVDIIWAKSEEDALSMYIKRTTGYWGHCDYSVTDLYAELSA